MSKRPRRMPPKPQPYMFRERIDNMRLLVSRAGFSAGLAAWYEGYAAGLEWRAREAWAEGRFHDAAGHALLALTALRQCYRWQRRSRRQGPVRLKLEPAA